ncbi:MAG: hypothetical protein IJ220_09210 [Clostridia bacterium]|nr:hypothetical protein [Clostridia bacterium]
MIYILQKPKDRNHENFYKEVLARREYLYDIFQTYFVLRKIVNISSQKSYYIIESFPFNCFSSFFMIVGNTDFVIEYIKTHKNTFKGKTLIIVTCMLYNRKELTSLLSKLRCNSIYFSKLKDDEAEYFDGSKWKLNFMITLSELDFYNSNNNNIIKRLEESFERMR